MQVRSLERSPRARMCNSCRQPFQSLYCLLHSKSCSHNANLLPHHILNLSNYVFDSRIHRTIL
jgi:hypothetical protein